MGGLRLRTKFLLSMVAVTAALTFTTLFVVRHTVQEEVRLEIQRDLHNSVSAFHNFQKQREVTLERSAALLADLPNVRALMTTRDAATIQDASHDLWNLAGSDLLLLADPSGKVMALQASPPEITVARAQEFFPKVVSRAETRHWWYVEGHLYEVFLQDIYFGPASGQQVLGYLVLGYEIDDRVARELSQVAASEVAFGYGDAIVRSTLKPSQEEELLRTAQKPLGNTAAPDQVRLGDERFLATTVDLSSPTTPGLRLWVLKSFDQATAFLSSLNELLLSLGLAAVLAGSLLVFLISHTFTRPLGTLVAGVRALGHGDYAYPLSPQGGDEVAEVTGAFDRMAAVMANAEFLCESNLTPGQREDLYAEIRIAVKQMTDLIESLLEFSRTRESLHPSYGDVRQAVDSAIKLLKAHPEFQRVRIRVSWEGTTEGWFDFKKLERALLNLLLNACEVVPAENGQIEVELRRNGQNLEIRISDNGPGIAEAVRGKLFEPFVSYGKENGTGMGLTVVQKILQDHGGDVAVEQSSPEGTTFRVSVPLNPSFENALAVKNAT